MSDDRKNFMAAIGYLAQEAQKMNMTYVANKLVQVIDYLTKTQPKARKRSSRSPDGQNSDESIKKGSVNNDLET